MTNIVMATRLDIQEPQIMQNVQFAMLPMRLLDGDSGDSSFGRSVLHFELST